MYYTARVSQEGRSYLAQFLDAPGCQTFSASRSKLVASAAEALEGWLEAHLQLDRTPPRPLSKPPALKTDEYLAVEVDPALALSLQSRWAREDAGLTVSSLAKRARVGDDIIKALENPASSFMRRWAKVQRVASVLNEEPLMLGLSASAGGRSQGRPTAKAVKPRRTGASKLSSGARTKASSQPARKQPTSARSLFFGSVSWTSFRGRVPW